MYRYYCYFRGVSLMQSNKANFDFIAAVVPKLNLKFFICCFKKPACSSMFPSFFFLFKRVLRLLEKKIAEDTGKHCVQMLLL